MAVNRILTNTLQACFSRQRYSLHFAQSLEHGGRVRILRIEREGFLVVLDGLGLVSRGHVGFAEANVRVCRIRRSEEHTSELQSRPQLVCRLLLGKKNTQS